LCRRFESRLATHFGVADGAAVTVANATLGLTLALLVQDPPAGSLCLMPAWSFAACPHAARMAGLVPFLLDVEPTDWQLAPAAVRAAIADAGQPVGAIMVVAPFGQPIEPGRWEPLIAEAGLAAVFDCAAGFDALRPSAIPAVVSLHATKVLCSGEGGFILSTDLELVQRIHSASNFGFSGTREAALPASNAKMSEYHAAIGLTALDHWRETRAAFGRVALQYRRAFSSNNRIRLQDGYGDNWVAATTVARFEDVPAKIIAGDLADVGIDSRFWWSSGIHRQSAFSAMPRVQDLTVTDGLAAQTLGLPCFLDLTDEDIGLVCATIARSMATAG
jgi:dTDP-4-amino-4,6-dideoxygalactose transaminase